MIGIRLPQSVRIVNYFEVASQGFTIAVKLSLWMREYSKTKRKKPGSEALVWSQPEIEIFDEKDLMLIMEEHVAWFRAPNMVRN
ncbi:hypothetical protein GQ457_04G031740 [Hibiscus cannabinus]